VPENFTVGGVQLLNLQVQHPDTGELVVTLRAPDGTTITPISGLCPGASNWRALTLDDAAPRALGEDCAPDLDDAFRPPPGQELAQFIGKPAQGEWVLQIVDTRGGNAGTLDGWSLLFLD
jgi:subtilisin-like proprotein convertase family protein